MTKIESIDMRSLISRDADWHLSNWARWTAAYRPALGFRSSCAVCRSPASSSFDDLVEGQDAQDAEVADAVIYSLPPAQSAVICNVYLASVWRHRGDPVQVFVEAVAAFWALAQKRGLA